MHSRVNIPVVARFLWPGPYLALLSVFCGVPHKTGTSAKGKTPTHLILRLHGSSLSPTGDFMRFLRRKQKINTDQPSTSEAENPTTKTKTKSHKSTLKQEKFVEGVVRHGNATRAAREAGYSPRSASALASRNLKRPDIQEQIKARIEAAKVDTDEIIGTLIGHMRADIGNLIGDDGALDLVRAIENGSTHLIKKLTIRTRRIAGPTGNTGRSLTAREGVAPDPATNLTASEAPQDIGNHPIEETTYEIVLHDSQSAAWRLARILHLEVKNRPIEARRPTDDELAHRMADLLERARARGRREGAAAAQRPPTQTMESHSVNGPEPLLKGEMSSDLRSGRGNAESSPSPIQKSPANREMPPACPSESSRWQLQDSRFGLEGPLACPVESSRWLLQKSRAEQEMPRFLPQEQADPFQPHRRISNAGEPPAARNGLWNRLFGSAEILTFINPLKIPFKHADDFGASPGRIFAGDLRPAPSLFGTLRY
jgi:hypothetical protein